FCESRLERDRATLRCGAGGEPWGTDSGRRPAPGAGMPAELPQWQLQHLRRDPATRPRPPVRPRAGSRRGAALRRRAAGGLRAALAPAAGPRRAAGPRAGLPVDRLRAGRWRRVPPAPARAGRQAAALSRRAVSAAAARGWRVVGLLAGLGAPSGPL